MTISVYTEKSFDNILHPFMVKKKKTLQKVGIEAIYLNIITIIYDRPRASIIFSGEKLKD